MSVSRKENGDLVKKAGIGIIDNILNKFSNRAISNGAVSKEFEKIREEMAKMGVKRIQKGTYSVGANTAWFTTKSITLEHSVNPDKCIVILDNANNGGGSNAVMAASASLVSLTDTTLTIQETHSYYMSCLVSWQVVEYN